MSGLDRPRRARLAARAFAGGHGHRRAAGLAACQLPGSGPPPREFRLTPKTTFDELPKVDWSLVVARPEASPAIDTTRIAVVRTGLEIEYYADARWVDRPAAMLQPILVQSFRNSGAITVVADDRADVPSGVRPQYRPRHVPCAAAGGLSRRRCASRSLRA